jgi:hypothetical protein
MGGLGDSKKSGGCGIRLTEVYGDFLTKYYIDSWEIFCWMGWCCASAVRAKVVAVLESAPSSGNEARGVILKPYVNYQEELLV